MRSVASLCQQCDIATQSTAQEPSYCTICEQVAPVDDTNAIVDHIWAVDNGWCGALVLDGASPWTNLTESPYAMRRHSVRNAVKEYYSAAVARGILWTLNILILAFVFVAENAYWNQHRVVATAAMPAKVK